MAVKATAAVRKLVVIEESLLVSMAQNQKFTKEFPFLKGLARYAASKGGCGGCGANRSNSTKATVYTQAKQTIAGMGDVKKRALKKLLNAAKVRITYKQGARIVQHTF